MPAVEEDRRSDVKPGGGLSDDKERWSATMEGDEDEERGQEEKRKNQESNDRRSAPPACLSTPLCGPASQAHTYACNASLRDTGPPRPFWNDIIRGSYLPFSSILTTTQHPGWQTIATNKLSSSSNEAQEERRQVAPEGAVLRLWP